MTLVIIAVLLSIVSTGALTWLLWRIQPRDETPPRRDVEAGSGE